MEALMSAFDSLPRFDHLQDLPPISYLVEDLITEGTVTFVAGLPGAGKSLLAQSFAVSVVSGQRWFGREVEKGPVLYVTTDASARQTHERFRAWEASNFKKLPHPNLRYLDRLDLTNKQDQATLKEIAKCGVRLLVIDVLATSIADMNLMEQAQVATLHLLFRDLISLSEGKLSIIVLAHSPKASKGSQVSVSGSVQLEGMADLVLVMSKGATGSKLSVRKNRNGPEGAEISFTIESQEIEAGLESAILRAKELATDSESERRGLDALTETWESNAIWRRRTGLPETTSRRVRLALVTSGLLEQKTEGRSLLVRCSPASPNPRHNSNGEPGLARHLNPSLRGGSGGDPIDNEELD
jgi:putative DNA primase/helicase